MPSDAVVATLPFLADGEPNRIYVDLAPEGRAPFRLMLDTGASSSVFTPLAARAAGVSVRALKRTPYRHSTRLGRDLQFQVDTRFSDTGARTGWEYGLLGANFLDKYVLELDFAAGTVRFLDPEKYAVSEQTTDAAEAIVPMKLISGRPLIEIGVGGRPIEVMLDTGCPVTAVLSGSPQGPPASTRTHSPTSASSTPYSRRRPRDSMRRARLQLQGNASRRYP